MLFSETIIFINLETVSKIPEQNYEKRFPTVILPTIFGQKMYIFVTK